MMTTVFKVHLTNDAILEVEAEYHDQKGAIVQFWYNDMQALALHQDIIQSITNLNPCIKIDVKKNPDENDNPKSTKA